MATDEYEEVHNVKQAEEYLIKHDNDCLIKISTCIALLVGYNNSWNDIIHIEDKIKSKIVEMHTLYPTPKARISFDCVLFNQLHDLFMPLVHEEFRKTDEMYFNKVLELENVTVEQLGGRAEYTIPLLAAVVELASLDHHKSPLEKMHCLRTTYDLIFAELKAAMISTISKSASMLKVAASSTLITFLGKDCEIPIIDNSDITPILITVIVRSKLIHLYSNFYYIQTFFEWLDEVYNFRHVLDEFEAAIFKMSQWSKGSLKSSSVLINQNMDLSKFILVTSDIQNKIRIDENEMTPLENHLHSVTELIVKSTNQNQILPP